MVETSEGMDPIGDNVETLGETPGDGVEEPIGAKVAIGMEVGTKVTIETKIGTEAITAETAGDKVEAGVHDRTTGINHPPIKQATHLHGDTHTCHTQDLHHQRMMVTIRETARRDRIQKTSEVGSIDPTTKLRQY